NILRKLIFYVFEDLIIYLINKLIITYPQSLKVKIFKKNINLYL
ncbi:hypothetical protein M8044_000552, partial [Columbia Basin potato purple top phytoplasma]|nr:hypothetical protein [Columbia Basin potato purple top phytoplasma]